MSVPDRSPSDREHADEETISVAIPSRPWALPLGIGAAVLLGGVVFWQLNANRTRAEERVPDLLRGLGPSASYASEPARNPPAPSSAALPQLPIDQRAPSASAAQQPPPDLESRLHSPSLVVDLSQADQPATSNAGGDSGPAAAALARAAGAGASRNADVDFAARLGVSGDGASARAERMSNQSYTLGEGSVIPAVLETAIHSDLPGFVRAIVSRDVRSFDGANVLAPRGSRLVGQYRSGVALGQSRAFVIWTRLIRPDGVGVDLGAPGTDALGRGGLEGRVDRHFLQRFGGAILLSLISVGGTLASERSDTQVIIASTSSSASSAASVALQSDLNIAPTVEVAQGAPIRVFVTRDLDFSILNQPQ